MPCVPVCPRRDRPSHTTRLNSRGSLLHPASLSLVTRGPPLRGIRTFQQVQPTQNLCPSFRSGFPELVPPSGLPGTRRHPSVLADRTWNKVQCNTEVLRGSVPKPADFRLSSGFPEFALRSWSSRHPKAPFRPEDGEHRTEPGVTPRCHEAPISRSTSSGPAPGFPVATLRSWSSRHPKAPFRPEAPDIRTRSGVIPKYHKTPNGR